MRMLTLLTVQNRFTNLNLILIAKGDLLMSNDNDDVKAWNDSAKLETQL